MYSIKFTDNTILPTQLVERYRTTDGPALKTALYFLLNKQCDAEKLSAELNMPLEIAERSIRFWLDAGLIQEGEFSFESTPSEETKTSTVNVDNKPLSHHKEITTFLELSQKVMRDPQLSVLMQEAQEYVGRPLTNPESVKLANLYIETGMPAEVLLMAVAYSNRNGSKGFLRHLENTVYKWQEFRIFTVEDAENYLILSEKREEREKTVEELVKPETSLNKRDKKFIAIWFEEYGFDLNFVNEALIRGGKNNIPYINSILKSWYEKGYKTIKDIEFVPNNIQPQGRKAKAEGGASLLSKAVKKKKKDSDQ